ncbi:hypothetical protein PBI_SPORTO_66 [Arthrobacter phage Sporto]|nr:hypothetical protein PBI_SPORTO_66 [Arthrobacter phage Sporto]
MDFAQILSWSVVAIGLIGFYFAGKKKWWSWYINLFCQILWWTYALVTGQPAFLVSAAVYSAIFAVNAYKWTKDHLYVKKLIAEEEKRKAVSFKSTQDKLNVMFPEAEAITRKFNLDVMNQYGPIHLPESDGMIIHNTKLDGSPTHTPLDIELIARTCHEANRVLQMSHDDEQLSYPWHLASDEQKASSIEGVKKALEGATAMELHEAWARRKLADGWVYGETKDEGIKTHPCLVPYLKLPEEQRIKDHMFRAIVKAFKVDAQEKASVI